MSFCASPVYRRWVLALAGAAFVALALSMSSLPGVGGPLGASPAHAATATASTSADCNHNGTPDTQESNWANRDDDGDGVCNGVDVCPFEADPTQDLNRCQLQAITVPFRPDDLSIPHPTYSGATVTLKGIARYGGNQFMWDFGDGSSPMAWTAIADPYNLGVSHTYTGAPGRLYVATLYVRSSASPTAVSTAQYRLKIEQSAAAVATISDPRQLDVRARMALDEGLWSLHRRLARGAYADGSPGWRQGYAYSSAGTTPTCVVLDAFEMHGSNPGRDWSTDPYAEDAQRALTFVLAGSSFAAIAAQPAGNPDVNGNGFGVLAGGGSTLYDNGVCAMALADSGTPGTITPAGPSNVYGRRLADVSQDTVDWFAYAQADSGPYRGGWGYYANDQSANGESFRWPILAMGSAERKLGATVPGFVRAEIPYYLAYSHYTAADAYNGGWGWGGPSDYLSVGFTAAGIVAHEFLGDDASSPDIKPAVGFLYRHWSDAAVSGLFGNLGDSDAMYTVMRALQDASPAALTRVTEFNYTTGLQTANSFDWYHAPVGPPQVGYATDLASRQSADGSWSDTDAAGAHGMGVDWSTAWDTIVLARGAALGPLADIGGPYSTDRNTSTQLDASRSIGTGLTYSWDLDGNGTFGDAIGVTATYQWSTYSADALGNPLAGAPVYNVCVRATDTAGRADTSCTSVTVKPPPHPPVARLATTYYGMPNMPVTFSAAASTDVDGDPLTFAWDFHNNGAFADATGVTTTYTFTMPGTYVVCLKATDNPTLNPAPYAAPQSSSTTCAYLLMGVDPPNDPPVAVIASPSVTVSGPLPRTVTFDASPSYDPNGDTISYSWTFDDAGASAATGSAVATHTYTSFGTYAAHVTVSDGMLTSTATATISVVDTTPGVPTGLAAGAVATGVGLTWSAPSGATGYEVFRSTDGGVTFASLGTTPSASFTDAAASAGATYTYAVTASSAGGISGRSAPASITLAPAAPMGLAATASAGAISLTWAASPGATGYGVSRSTDGGLTYASIGTAAGTSLSDTAVTAGATYGYQVTATNAGGTSGPSAAASATIPVPAPSLTAPGAGTTTVGTNATVTGVALPGATVTILDGGTSVATLVATASGAFSGLVVLGYGHHVLAARQSVGAVTSTPSAAVGVDLAPAAPTIVAPALSRSPVAVSGTGVPGAVVAVIEGGLSVGSFTVAAGGSWGGAIALVDGVHVLSAHQSIAGATSANSGTIAVTVDTVPPTVTYTGNAGTYAADQTVTIRCVASDPGSGLASSTCVDITGPASSFGTGSHTFTATATDLAGNTATATTTFTVTAAAVTARSVCKLAKQFVQGSAKYRSQRGERRDDAGDIAEGLCEKLDSLAERVNPVRRAALLKSFALQAAGLVRAGWLTAAQADTLTELAQRISGDASRRRTDD